MSNQSIIRLMAGLLFIFPTNGYGQEIMTTEQEREIKLSGKYFFGECIAFEEEEARDCALKELTQEVIVAMLQQTLIGEKEALLKNMEMNINIMRLPMPARFRILAYIAKDSIYEQNASVGDNTIVKPEDTVSNTEPKTVISKEDLQPASTEDNSSRPIISDPVVQDLADGSTYDLFRRKADSWRRQGKLVYGSRKTAFLHPEDCYIAVFVSGTLIALLGEGNNSRIDLLTGKTVLNPEQHYRNNNYVWIQINK